MMTRRVPDWLAAAAVTLAFATTLGVFSSGVLLTMRERMPDPGARAMNERIQDLRRSSACARFHRDVENAKPGDVIRIPGGFHNCSGNELGATITYSSSSNYRSGDIIAGGEDVVTHEGIHRHPPPVLPPPPPPVFPIR